jgi:hypothetical protein
MYAPRARVRRRRGRRRSRISNRDGKTDAPPRSRGVGHGERRGGGRGARLDRASGAVLRDRPLPGRTRAVRHDGEGGGGGGRAEPVRERSSQPRQPGGAVPQQGRARVVGATRDRGRQGVPVRAVRQPGRVGDGAAGPRPARQLAGQRRRGRPRDVRTRAAGRAPPVGSTSTSSRAASRRRSRGPAISTALCSRSSATAAGYPRTDSPTSATSSPSRPMANEPPTCGSRRCR